MHARARLPNTSVIGKRRRPSSSSSCLSSPPPSSPSSPSPNKKSSDSSSSDCCCASSGLCISKYTRSNCTHGFSTLIFCFLSARDLRVSAEEINKGALVSRHHLRHHQAATSLRTILSSVASVGHLELRRRRLRW